MVRIEWNEIALEDLKEIHDYIARDSNNYANLFVKKLYDAVQNLKDFPKIGRIVPETNIPSIRVSSCLSSMSLDPNADTTLSIVSITIFLYPSDSSKFPDFRTITQ